MSVLHTHEKGRAVSVRSHASSEIAGWPRASASDNSVRDQTVTAKLKAGNVAVECKINGVLFGFPLAVWPADSWTQAQWVERLTPWWDMSEPDWSPQAQRLRASCRAAINKLSASMQNRLTAPVAAAARETAGECTGADSLSSANAADHARPLGAVACGRLFEEPAGKASVNSTPKALDVEARQSKVTASKGN